MTRGHGLILTAIVLLVGASALLLAGCTDSSSGDAMVCEEAVLVQAQVSGVLSSGGQLSLQELGSMSKVAQDAQDQAENTQIQTDGSNMSRDDVQLGMYDRGITSLSENQLQALVSDEMTNLAAMVSTCRSEFPK